MTSSLSSKTRNCIFKRVFVTTMAGDDKSKGKQVAKKRKEDYGDYLEFILTHFPRPLLRKRFLDNFMSRSVIPPYFVNLSNLANLKICDKSFRDFLITMD